MKPYQEQAGRGQSRPYLTTLLLLLAGLLLAACGDAVGPAAGSDDDSTLHIVATTSIVADAVRNVGGEHARVESLMGPGIDPHLYRATESDVNRLSRADVIFYNGLFLEARMTTIFEQMGRSRPVIAVGDAISPDQLLANPDYENQPDPHIWMDVKLWMQVVEKIRDELIRLDPENEAAYRANAAAYLQELEELEAHVQETIAALPRERRILVTAHDAFSYFGRGYDFDVHAPQGISTESEAGVEDIRETIDLVVERQAPAIFVETSVPPNVVEAVVAGARSRGHDLIIGGELYSDALGPAGTPAGTYIGMIRHNVDTIVQALQRE